MKVPNPELLFAIAKIKKAAEPNGTEVANKVVDTAIDYSTAIAELEFEEAKKLQKQLNQHVGKAEAMTFVRTVNTLVKPEQTPPSL